MISVALAPLSNIVFSLSKKTWQSDFMSRNVFWFHMNFDLLVPNYLLPDLALFITIHINQWSIWNGNKIIALGFCNIIVFVIWMTPSHSCVELFSALETDLRLTIETLISFPLHHADAWSIGSSDESLQVAFVTLNTCTRTGKKPNLKTILIEWSAVF